MLASPTPRSPRSITVNGHGQTIVLRPLNLLRTHPSCLHPSPFAVAPSASHPGNMSPFALIDLPPAARPARGGTDARTIYRQSKDFSPAHAYESLPRGDVPLLTGRAPASRALTAVRMLWAVLSSHLHQRLRLLPKSGGPRRPWSVGGCQPVWVDATQLFAHVAPRRRGILRALEAVVTPL